MLNSYSLSVRSAARRTHSRPAMRLQRFGAAALGAAALSLLGLHPAQAQTDAWSTAPGSNTFSGNNWTVNSTTPGAATGTLTAGAVLYFGASNTTALTDDETAGYSLGGFNFSSLAAAFTITGNSFALNGGITNSSTSLQTINDAFTLAGQQTFTTTTGGGDLTLGGAISGAGSVIAAGTGTLNFTGTVGLTGGSSVAAPTLLLNANNTVNLSGTGTDSLVNISTGLSGASNTLNITGGTLKLTGGTVGLAVGGSGGSGVINQTGGTVTVANNVSLGDSGGGYGNYNISNGTLGMTAGMRNGGYNGTGANSTGYSLFNLSGSGIVNNAGNTVLGRGNTAAAGTNVNVLNITGGQFNQTANSLYLGYSAGSTGIVNISGGTLTQSANNIQLNNGNTAATTSIFNLNGGTVIAPQITNLNTGAGVAIVNFNGGTLQANVTGTILPNNLTSANIFSGGLTFNTNGFTDTIAQALVAPAGSGLSSIALTSGGSGYIGAPVVVITGGGGTGATALANINSSGQVTGFTITSAGTGYTSAPTVTLQGGGGTGVTGLTATTAANTSGGLTVTGTGTLILSGINTYTGGTTVNSGTLELSNGGGAGAVRGVVNVNSGATLLLNSNNALGYNNDGSQVSTVNINGGTVTTSGALSDEGYRTSFNLTGGTLAYVGSTAGNAYQFAAADPLAPGISSNASATTSLISGDLNIRSGNLGFNVASGTTTSGVDLNVTGVILGGTGYGITKTGNGVMALTNANTYTGPTTISAGTLELGSGGTTGTLATGSAITDNGNFTINRSNNVTQGTDFSAAAITGSGSLTQAGGGILTLNAANTYSGGTNVNSGTLNLTGSLGAGAVTVANGATLTGFGNGTSTGEIGGSLTVNGGGIVNLAVANSGTLTDAGALTLGGGTGSASILNYTTGVSLEELTAGGALTLNSGGATVNLIGSTLNVGTYNLIGFSSQTGSGMFDFSNGTTTENVGRDTYTLTDNGTNLLSLGVSGIAVPNVAYFNGAAGNTVWNNPASPTNFSTDLAGKVDAGNSPAAVTDVILNASNETGTLSETLGASTTINSLNVNGNGNTTIAADGSTLTINGQADNNTASDNSYTGNAAGSGINIAAGANAFTVSAPLVVGGTGAAQTWTNGSSSLFTVNGAVTGTALIGSSQTLTLTDSGSGGTTLAGVVSDPTAAGNLALTVNNTGTGITTLSGANTFTGATTISAGTLDLANQLALQDSTLALNGGSVTFDAGAGNAFTLGNLSGSANLALTNNAATPAPIVLTLGGSSVGTAYSGILSGGGSLTRTGTGTTILSGMNTYTGATTTTGGTLSLTGTLGSGGGTAISSGATFNEGSAGVIAGTSSLAVTGGTTTLAGVNTYTGATTITGGTLSLTGTLGSGGGTAISSGATFNEGSAGVIAGTSSLAVTGGTTTLSGANTYTGGTTVNGGTLALNLSSGSGTVQGAVNVNSGATLSLTASNALGFNAGSQVTQVNINGGTVSVNGSQGNEGYRTSFNLTGGTLAYGVADATGGNAYQFAAADATAPGITSNASAITSLISGGLNIRSGNLGFNVASGTTASGVDLNDTGLITGGGGDGITKTGAGTLKLVNAANSFTGNVLITGGTLSVGVGGGGGTNGGVTVLGSDAAAGRTITVGNGTANSGTLGFTLNNIFGNGQANSANIPNIIVNSGGLVTSSRYNVIGAVTLNGGTLTQNSTDTGNYQGYQILGNVTVGGTSASTISNGASNAGDHLGSNTQFTVASTGATGPDLTVSAPLLNESGDFNNAAGGFTKLGAGTMALSGANTYTGGTTITGGTLALSHSAADGTGALSVTGAGSIVQTAVSGALGGGNVTLTAGGTLQNTDLTANGSIANDTPPTNNTQSSGTLTVGSSGIAYLDFGAGNTGAIFDFTGANNAAWNGTLDVLNWNGNYAPTGGGLDQLIIGGAALATDPTTSLVDNIFFVNPTGNGVTTSGTVGAFQLADGEVTAAPEPSEWAGLGFTVFGIGGLMFRARRRKAGEVAAEMAS